MSTSKEPAEQGEINTQAVNTSFRDNSPAPRGSSSDISPPRPSLEETSIIAARYDISKEQTIPPLRWKLYTSHFLSTWNARGFEFGAVLFLASIFPDDLLPLSIYALTRAGITILLSGRVGRYIDTTERLKIVRTSIVWQRLAVVVSCTVFLCMLWSKNTKALPVWGLYVMLTITIILACVEKLCAVMNLVSVERDWVVVIAEADEHLLRTLNSQMRRIDLVCKLISPLLVALLDGWSTEIAVLVTLVANGVSMMVEYVLIAQVYRQTPALAKKQPREQDTEGNSGSDVSVKTVSGDSIISNLIIYASQRAFLPSLSLSVLYLTVLSFSGQMVTYLLAIGYTSLSVGLIRATSTVFELSATWLAPRAMQRIGPVRSGIWFLSTQMICLGIGTFFFWTIPDPLWAATGLVVGIVVSRVGLWGLDLCAQVIIQEEVEPQYRGVFSTTEAALQNLFELGAYVSTVVFRRPGQFRFPAVISIVAVYVAGALYAKFVRDRRGHLIHASACLKGRKTHDGGYRRIDEILLHERSING